MGVYFSIFLGGCYKLRYWNMLNCRAVVRRELRTYRASEMFGAKNNLPNHLIGEILIHIENYWELLTYINTRLSELDISAAGWRWRNGKVRWSHERERSAKARPPWIFLGRQGSHILSRSFFHTRLWRGESRGRWPVGQSMIFCPLIPWWCAFLKTI